ncbi:MAG: DNA pilot protein [Microviridae sp.]|nr:MAG: DNA pilot protein [Microviridae sp.]
MDPISTAIGAGGEVLGMLTSQATAKQQYKRTQQLMSKQQHNQMALNQQGQNLQMQTWRDTNYPAQVAMLKEAGLNPSLLYGKGGGGGATTGSQGGGSASMGQAQQANPMGIESIMQMNIMKAQTELIEAQKNKTIAETPKTGNLGDTSIEGTKARAEADRASANESNMRSKALEIANAYSAQEKETVIAKQAEETKKIALENQWTQEQWINNTKLLEREVLGKYLENELTKTKTDMTETQIKQIKTEIVQKWTELSQKATGLDQEAQKIELEKFKAEIQNRYPSIMNVSGGLIQGALNQLEVIGRYFNPKVFDYADRKPK